MSRLSIVLIVLALGLPATSCAGPAAEGEREEPAASGAPVDAPPGDEEEAELEALAAEADRLLARRDYQAALDTVDVAIARAQTLRWANRLRVLRFQIKQRMLGETLLDAFVRVDRDRVEVGEIVEGDVVLMNISRLPVVVEARVTVPAQAPGLPAVETRTLLRRTTTYTEYAADGTVATNVDAMSVAIDEDIRLEPGEAFRIPVALDTGVRADGPMLRRYDLACTLHAARIRVGDEIFNDALTFRPSRVAVYPRNWEHLADDPLARVDQALAKRSAVHLPLAASLVSPERHHDLYARLARALRDPDVPAAMKAAAMASLRIVSGADPAGGRDGWLSWLADRGHR